MITKGYQKQVTVSGIAQATVFPILLSISFSHLLNDSIQSLIPSIYPIVKSSFNLSFAQIGLITLTFQLAASLLQPFVGYSFADSFEATLLSVGFNRNWIFHFSPRSF